MRHCREKDQVCHVLVVIEQVNHRDRQLSNGHFSDENQKRLSGSTGIPIFEAKMQRDLRLVVSFS